MSIKGVYCICVSVEDDLKISVGSLGKVSFPVGQYLYIGSAMNGLEARILRHINTSRGITKAIHWHIDYLLKEPTVRIDSIYVKLTEEKMECALAAEVSMVGEPVNGFGCSDCMCTSHLFKVEGCDFLSRIGMDVWHPSNHLH